MSQGRGYSQKNWVGVGSTYGQNQRFLLPYLCPEQNFNTLFMTIAAGTVALKIIYEEILLMVSSKKWLLLKTIPNSRLYSPYKEVPPDFM